MWKTVKDAQTRHTWECEECHTQTKVHPTFYEESGTPICGDCGDDMSYLNTQVATSEDDNIDD